MPKNEAQVNNLIKKAKSGLKWTAFIKFTAQIISWSITLIIVRYLTPVDFGLKAMSELIFAFLTLLATGGINSSIIQSKNLSHFQLRQVFTILLLFNLVLCFIQNILSFYIADYYNEQRLIFIFQFLSIGYLILPFISIHYAILNRNMEFKKTSIVMLIANVSGGILTLLFAINQLGVWSLIYGQLITLFLRAIGLIIVSGGLLKPTLNFNGISSLLKFGGVVLSTTIIWYIFQKMDIIIGGRLLGTETIGYYVVALHIASLPMEKIVPLLNQIAFPAYSRMQTNSTNIKYYFLKSIRVVSCTIIPIFLGLAILSENFVLVVFGDKWLDIAIPLSILSITTCMRSLNNLFAPVVNAMGHPEVQFINALISLFIMSPSIFIGVNWGVVGLSYAWLSGYTLVYIITSVRSCRSLNIHYLTYLSQIFQAFLPTSVMVTIIYFLKKYIIVTNYSWLSFAFLIIIGVIVYIIATYILNRKVFFELLSILKK